MNTSMVALGIALSIGLLLVVSVVGLNLLLGALEFLLGRPRFKILKSTKGDSFFAFQFDFNEHKEPAQFDRIKVRFFNPFGKPTQLEFAKELPPQAYSFAEEVDLGPAYIEMKKYLQESRAEVHIDMVASKDGVVFSFKYNMTTFAKKLASAVETVPSESTPNEVETNNATAFDQYTTHLPKSMVADTVPGKGVHLKIATNPVFAHLFQGPVPGQKAAAGGAGGADAAPPVVENFKVAKVWIAPGCIVCNACEDIYPEVFDVQAQTCLIRPDAGPGSKWLEDGLKIKDAAEACPVEVIKYQVG